MKSLELWGGIECTVNRVGNQYFDQLRFNGHHVRADDIERIADLGIRTVRYPVIWERVAPQRPEELDWRWSDERLHRLQQAGIDPVIGLVHHGSGPSYTSLLDPEFPTKLARYARQVAERYPWVRRYTPINEPLTTARFSGLYGHWYPHLASEKAFVQCLVHECQAIIAAMREIRKVQPDAELILTEDLGCTSSTPRLAYQASHENKRRWLSMDLLCGRVDRTHPLWRYLLRAGANPSALGLLQESHCPPDMIGINHYLTSNRYIDENLSDYPLWSHGGNKRHRYADVEAVRVRQAPQVDRMALLREAWERYKLPLAITESHLDGPRDEQMRWLHEIWQGARVLRTEGIDVRAVTVWSLFGSFDWACLVTRCNGVYEPGVYDVRSPAPRPTAMTTLIKQLTLGEHVNHPALLEAGWWRRPERALYPPSLPNPQTSYAVERGGLLITGARGTLGRAFARVCEGRGLFYKTTTRQELDITDVHSISQALERIQPWAVINAAGYVRVDQAEDDQQRCSLENIDGPARLAAACRQRGIPFVTFSSDLVFDGARPSPYLESDAPAPLNHYGWSKWAAEKAVQKEYPSALIVRTSAFFGPWDPHNFLTQTLLALAARESVAAADDIWVSPTYVPDLVHTVLDLLMDREKGVWHIANAGATTWAGFAYSAAQQAGLDPRGIEKRSSQEMGWKAARPRYSVLASERGRLLSPLTEAVQRYVQDTDLKFIQPIAA